MIHLGEWGYAFVAMGILVGVGWLLYLSASDYHAGNVNRIAECRNQGGTVRISPGGRLEACYLGPWTQLGNQ